MDYRHFLLILIFILVILPLILYYMNSHILWFLYIILIICLLPSIIFYSDLFIRGVPFLMGKVIPHNEMKKEVFTLLDSRFGLKIDGFNKYDTPVIYLLNHHGYNTLLDNCVSMIIPGKTKIVMYKKIGLFTKIFDSIDYIYIERSGNGRLSNFLEECEKELKNNNDLIIFPEGKYSNDKQSWRDVYKFQTGAFILACKSLIPIVPVIISGSSYHDGIYSSNPIYIKYLPKIEPKGWDAIGLRDYTFLTIRNALATIA